MQSKSFISPGVWKLAVLVRTYPDVLFEIRLFQSEGRKRFVRHHLQGAEHRQPVSAVDGAQSFGSADDDDRRHRERAGVQRVVKNVVPATFGALTWRAA